MPPKISCQQAEGPKIRLRTQDMHTNYISRDVITQLVETSLYVYVIITSCTRCGHRGISPASIVDDNDDDDDDERVVNV